jgi:GT2 family glycosyltransferase
MIVNVKNEALGVIIATRNRPELIGSLLESIFLQSLQPVIVAVSDSSDDEIKAINRATCEQVAHLKNTRVVYLESEEKSLTAQKNLALDYLEAHENLFAVQILDDDTMPTLGFFQEQMNYLVKNPDVLGVSGLTFGTMQSQQNPETALVEFLLRLVGFTAGSPGEVSRAGNGLPVSMDQSGPVEAEWLIGCSMWKSEVFNSVRYLGSLKGSCLFEDVEFSVRAKGLGRLVVLPQVKLEHFEASEQRPNNELFAYRFNRNRFFVIRALPNPFVSRFYYFLSSLALVIYYFVNTAFGGKESRQQNFRIAKSSWRGLRDAVFNIEPK